MTLNYYAWIFASQKQGKQLWMRWDEKKGVISNGFAFCTADVNKNALISILNILSLCPLVVL